MPAFDRDDNRTIDEHYARSLDPTLQSGENKGSDVPYSDTGNGAQPGGDDVTSRENDAVPNPAWANNVTPNSMGNTQPKGLMNRLKGLGASAFAKKVGAPALVIIVILGAMAIGLFLVGTSGLVITTAQKAVEQTMYAAPAITMLRGLQLQQERLANLKNGTLTGVCGNVVSIGCKLATFSEDDIAGMNRENMNVKVKEGNAGSIWDKLKGEKRYVLESATVGDKVYSADELLKGIKSGDSAIVAKFTAATEPRWKTFAKNGFYELLSRFGGTKGVNIKNANDRATIEQELVDRVSGKTAAIESAGLEKQSDGTYKDPATGETYSDKGTGKNLTEFLKQKDAAFAKIEAVKEQLKASGDKISEFAAKNSVKAFAIGVGVAQIGCAAWNVVRTAETAGAQSGAQAMMAYAQVFLNEASAIRAGNGQAEVTSYLGDTLMTPNAAGITGTDSRAGKQLFLGEQSPIPTTTYADPQNPTAAEQKQALANSDITNYTSGATSGPETLKQVASAAGVKTDSPGWMKAADTTCSIINNPIVGGLMLGAGITVALGCFASAIVPIAGEATLGGCAADVAYQAATLGVIVAVLMGLQHLFSSISGTLITGKENGPQAMAAFVTGTENIGYNMGKYVGLVSGTAEDANTFKTSVSDPANKVYADIDREQYAWYDTSNTNTFLGSIVASMYPTVAAIGYSTNGLQALKSFGSLLSAPLSLFGSVAKADGQVASDYCASTIYSGLAHTQNCTGMAVTSQAVLNIDSQTARTYLQAQGEIDDGGTPIGTHFQEYLQYCPRREAPLGMALEGEIATPITTGEICTTAYAGADAETYRMIQAYLQVISATSDVDIYTKPGASGSSTNTSSAGPDTCADGMEKVPISEGWDDGHKKTITLCAISSLPRITLKDDGEFKKPVYGGLAAKKIDFMTVNSSAVDPLVQLITKAKSDGTTISATFSYRSYNEQKAIYNYKALDANGNTTSTSLIGNYNQPAAPGKSNHQMGLSLDFTDGSRDWIKKCISKNMDGGKDDGKCYGFIDNVSGDPNHFSYAP